MTVVPEPAREPRPPIIPQPAPIIPDPEPQPSAPDPVEPPVLPDPQAR